MYVVRKIVAVVWLLFSACGGNAESPSQSGAEEPSAAETTGAEGPPGPDEANTERAIEGNPGGRPGGDEE